MTVNGLQANQICFSVERIMHEIYWTLFFISTFIYSGMSEPVLQENPDNIHTVAQNVDTWKLPGTTVHWVVGIPVVVMKKGQAMLFHFSLGT